MKFTKFTPSAAVTITDWSKLRSKFGKKKANQLNITLRVLNSKKRKKCRLISVKTLNVLTSVFSFLTISNKLPHVWQTLKTEAVCCLLCVKNSA